MRLDGGGAPVLESGCSVSRPRLGRHDITPCTYQGGHPDWAYATIAYGLNLSEARRRGGARRRPPC